QPARALDHPGRVALRQDARDPAAAALRRGLHQHRLPAVHHRADRSGRPPVRTLAGTETGVRPARRTDHGVVTGISAAVLIHPYAVRPSAAWSNRKTCINRDIADGLSMSAVEWLGVFRDRSQH